MRTAPVRQSPIGPNGPRRDGLPPRASTRRCHGRWLSGLAMLAALGSSATLWAQETKSAAPGGSLGASASRPTGTTPLARYFPKEHLVFYYEFSGLDAHADAWNKTAAYKMLTETPLGEMLETVSAQLAEKLLSYVPGNRLNGKDAVTLVEHAARHGCAMGVHLKPSGKESSGESLAVTVVFRGAASKESREVWARGMRLLMANGSGNVRLDKRQGRTMAVILASAQATTLEGGRCWWAEQDDLVISARYPSGPDGVMAALDGKVPSAV